MPVIGRAGNHLLVDTVAEDPFGTLHRGVALRDGRFHRHLLVRVFSGELRAAGLSAKLAGAQDALLRLGPLKAYERYQVEGGPEPFAASPYAAGRSFAELFRKLRNGAAPMPMDSGLALIWSLAQEVGKLRGQGFHHGLLNPYSVWVGFDGQVQLLDAPLAGVFQELLPGTPVLQTALRPYAPPDAFGEAQRDLWQLGALAYELLTGEPLPMDDARQSLRREAVEFAALGGTDGRPPLPEELTRMLHRMLGTEGGFASLEAFNRDMERALFDGEHVPTTFGLAFYMHDAFLREANADAAALKAEKDEDFFSHTEAARRMQTRIQDNLSILSEAPVAARRRGRGGIFLAGALLAAAGAVLLFRARREAQIEALKAQVVASERRAAELAIQQGDLEHRDQEAAERRAQVEAQLLAAKDAAAQADLLRQLEEARRRQADLERQQARLEAEQRRLMDGRPVSSAKPAAAQESAAPPRPALPPAPPVPADVPPRLLVPVTSGVPAGFKGDTTPVKVRVFISEQGRPQKALVMGGDPALADLARQTALAGAYSPALHGGAPTRDWVTVSVPFVR